MRVSTRRTADRQQLVFDWNAAAVPATTERDNAIIDVEAEAAHAHEGHNGHERRDSSGRSPVLLSEARSSGSPESGEPGMPRPG